MSATCARYLLEAAEGDHYIRRKPRRAVRRRQEAAEDRADALRSITSVLAHR